jgi:hypothetical protein
MLASSWKKTVVLVIGGNIMLFLNIGLHLLQTRPTNAYDPASSTLLAQTIFPVGQTGEPVLGVFEGITPCRNTNRPLPQIPETTNCEMMIWKLTLYQDSATGRPTTYKLNSSYGVPQQGTRGLQGGGTKLNLEGKWTKLHGTTAYPNAEVYQLNPDNPQEAVNFIKMDNNILHVLTQDKRLMVGTAAWSYTLNRTDKKLANQPAAFNGPTSPTIQPPPITRGPSKPHVFEGRIPCVESIRALQHIAALGCQIVKLRLSLRQNTETNAPSTFELTSIYVGKEDTQYSATGTWVIRQGTKTDLGTTIYQLTPNETQQPLLFLRADDNHLFLLDSDLNLMVGDALMSYTLSRAD